MKSITRMTLVLVLIFAANQAHAQLDITSFGKGKKAGQPVLSASGGQPSLWDNLNPFAGNSPVLTFQKPASAVERFNESTQRVFEQTRDALAKPIRDIQDAKLWPNHDANRPNRSFSLVPEWLKTSSTQPQQPTTIADWLAQPRPE